MIATSPARVPLLSSSIWERLNADLKQATGKRVPVRTKAKLHEATIVHVMMLEQNSRARNELLPRQTCQVYGSRLHRAGAMVNLSEQWLIKGA